MNLTKCLDLISVVCSIVAMVTRTISQNKKTHQELEDFVKDEFDNIYYAELAKQKGWNDELEQIEETEGL